ncbi:glycosyltransferase family 4 protein [Sagittula sp. SSi028]|uniref:glycosyltransferase family 4 protein n=1 Tax=Sagittula sp. SSi028 TaxID=3400636 RepID=UPI003AF9E31F
MTRLRIAYLCDMDPLDTNLYSGGNARMFEALSAHADVTALPQDWGMADPVRRAILAMPDRVNLRARWRAHYALRAMTARRVQSFLQGYDVLFGAYALHSLAGVRVPSDMVMAFTSDAVQTVYRESAVGAAHGGRSMGRVLDRWTERREAAVLRRLDLALWPSDWLRTAVDERYDLAAGVGHVVEWGANIPPLPDPGPRVLEGPVNLLVIGRNWFAKGGPIAFEVLNILRGHGIAAHLTVIGCTPPQAHRNAHVTVHPQLDKSVPADLAVFDAALSSAHFLVQPSYESYGFAFCEASAYGLPSLCLRVGGVPVRDGENGYALAEGSGPDAFARIIRDLWADPARYAALSRSARTTYETRLNWGAWGRRVIDKLHDAVDRKRT